MSEFGPKRTVVRSVIKLMIYPAGVLLRIAECVGRAVSPLTGGYRARLERLFSTAKR